MTIAAEVTLNANLESILGGGEGGGYLRIILCGSGAVIPVVAGTCVLEDATIPQLIGPQVGSTPISQLLFGNDVITPNGTFYEIAVLDGRKNVVQAGMYQFAQAGGPNTVDLSTATQIPAPAPAQPWSPYQAITWTTNAGNLQLSGVNARTFDVTLEANVGTLQMTNFAPGTLVQLIIAQDATGGRAFPWPANVKNPPLVDAAANSITTAQFIARAGGNLYPVLGWS